MITLRSFILLGAMLLAWEFAARSDLWNPLLFPSLVNIGDEFVRFVAGTGGLHEA